MNSLIKKLQAFIEKSKFSGIVIALISFLLVFLFSTTEAYNLFEDKLYDLRFKMKPAISEWDGLTFINIDENSINSVGKHPWPRHIYASGLETLKEVGVRQVTFDIEFPDKSPQMINEPLFIGLKEKAEKRERIAQEELDEIILDNDRILAAGIKLFNNVILPFHFREDILEDVEIDEGYKDELKIAEKIFSRSASIEIPEEKKEAFKGLLDSKKLGIAVPIPELIKGARGFGFTDTDPDADGTERRIRLVRVFQGRLYFQMGLAMLMDLCEVGKEEVEILPGQHIILKNAINPITFQKKDITIPIDEKGMMYVNWAGPGPLEDSFSHLSYYALLEYPQVKDEVYDFFDEQEIKMKQKDRSRLYGELEKLESEYYANPDLSIKKESREKINKLRAGIREIEKGFGVPILKEIKEIEQELKKGENAELEQVLVQYKNYLKAIKIVGDVEALKDKIVITGLTATGTQDIGVVPIYNKYWMVGKYLNIMNTVLNKSFIIKIEKNINYIIMFVLAIIMGIVIQRLGARMSLLAILLSLVAINVISIGLFSFYNIWIEQIGVNMAVFLPSAFIAGIKLMKEESQKRYIKSAFSRYLAPGVIDRIIESPEALELGGENRIITIFFSDVAGFSTISEKLTPPELVKRLNEYLTEMTDIILAHGGTVDKYEGDAIMAFYGAPHSFEDHALRCLLASIDMKKKLREMQEVWRKIGVDELFVRMGMNTGEAVVGNMGSKARLDYTAMGDSVNLASRLEGANKYYKTLAMMSGTTYEMTKEHIEARKLDVIRVVGKTEPVPIYEVIGRVGTLPDKMYDMLEKYNEGLGSFELRDWKKALSSFKKALKIIEDDGPSLTYYERCEKFMKKPPPKKWDGVYKLTSK